MSAIKDLPRNLKLIFELSLYILLFPGLQWEINSSKWIQRTKDDIINIMSAIFSNLVVFCQNQICELFVFLGPGTGYVPKGAVNPFGGKGGGLMGDLSAALKKRNNNS